MLGTEKKGGGGGGGGGGTLAKFLSISGCQFELKLT